MSFYFYFFVFTAYVQPTFQQQWGVIYFPKVIKCLLDLFVVLFFREYVETVENKLKENSMTKPFPWIGGKTHKGSKGAKPALIYVWEFVERTIGKRSFYFC